MSQPVCARVALLAAVATASSLVSGCSEAPTATEFCLEGGVGM